MTDPFDAFVALTGDTLDHVNTIVDPLEDRLIILAQGKQFRNGDRASPWDMPQVLRLPGSDRANITGVSSKGVTFKLGELWPSLKKLPAVPLEDAPGGTFQLVNRDQGVRFRIKVVNTKDAFIDALNTAEAHVVYSGHARYGRGPCFGDGGDAPGEMWEEGSSAQDGIFRMGFPFIAVDVHDLKHGYTANLAPVETELTPADCDPDLRNLLGTKKGRTISEILAAIPLAVDDDGDDSNDPPGTPHFRNSDPDQKFWTVGSKTKMQAVMIAGWTDTLSSPNEIGAFDPTCRAFIHMACSTFKHNHPVVRKLKGWKHDGNERYAYWTTDLSDAIGDHYWLQHILTYDQFNAFDSWEKSLEFAKNKANSLLARDGERFRFI
ncbi:MAG TPA: hypothetical protein VGI10_14560 [Polyangiaceae bacterium]|jgi:hypothetical protein